MTAELFFHFVLYACIISIVAVVYLLILPHEPPFNKWFLWGEKHFKGTLIYNPVFYCQKCFCGQVALWTYLFIHAAPKKYYWGWGSWIGLSFPGYSIIEHIVFVSMAIFTVCIFTFIYSKIDN